MKILLRQKFLIALQTILLAACAQPPATMSTATAAVDQLLPQPTYVSDVRQGIVGPLIYKPTGLRQYTMAVGGGPFPFILEGRGTQVAGADGAIVASTFIDRLRVHAQGVTRTIEMKGLLLRRVTFAQDGTLLEAALIDYEDLSGDIKKSQAPFVSQADWTAMLQQLFNRKRDTGLLFILAASGITFPVGPIPIGTIFLSRTGDDFYAYAGEVSFPAVMRSTAAIGRPSGEGDWQSKFQAMSPAQRTYAARQIMIDMGITNVEMTGEIVARAISASCECVRLKAIFSADLQSSEGIKRVNKVIDMVFDPKLGFSRYIDESITGMSQPQFSRVVIE